MYNPPTNSSYYGDPEYGIKPTITQDYKHMEYLDKDDRMKKLPDIVYTVVDKKLLLFLPVKRDVLHINVVISILNLYSTRHLYMKKWGSIWKIFKGL
jgi:hypothetical protein